MRPTALRWWLESLVTFNLTMRQGCLHRSRCTKEPTNLWMAEPKSLIWPTRTERKTSSCHVLPRFHVNQGRPRSSCLLHRLCTVLYCDSLSMDPIKPYRAGNPLKSFNIFQLYWVYQSPIWISMVYAVIRIFSSHTRAAQALSARLLICPYSRATFKNSSKDTFPSLGKQELLVGNFALQTHSLQSLMPRPQKTFEFWSCCWWHLIIMMIMTVKPHWRGCWWLEYRSNIGGHEWQIKVHQGKQTHPRRRGRTEQKSTLMLLLLVLVSCCSQSWKHTKGKKPEWNSKKLTVCDNMWMRAINDWWRTIMMTKHTGRKGKHNGAMRKANL